VAGSRRRYARIASVNQPRIHEDFSRETIVRKSSDRTIGLLLAAVLLVVGLRTAGAGRIISLAGAGVVALMAFVRPSLLGPVNTLWTRVGIVLGRIVNPIVLAVLYYAVITPAGLLLRAAGQDFLRRRFDKNAASYWIPRVPPGPAPEDMLNQF